MFCLEFQQPASDAEIALATMTASLRVHLLHRGPLVQLPLPLTSALRRRRTLARRLFRVTEARKHGAGEYNAPHLHRPARARINRFFVARFEVRITGLLPLLRLRPCQRALVSVSGPGGTVSSRDESIKPNVSMNEDMALNTLRDQENSPQNRS